MKRAARYIAAVLLLTTVAMISIIRLTPPGRDDARDGFDTDRAIEHLRVIARTPHPMGSAANEIVRAYLVDEFEKLGLETRSPEQRVTARRGGRTFDHMVRNVVARLRGSADAPGRSQAVMLAAHYDSVEEGPGAGDDGAAVAALLDVARVLASGDKLKRDIIFLITDGEEQGLLGAKAFVTHDEWRGEPGVVFNFEARGASGPSVMFETTRDHAWLIDHYAQVAPHPVTTSLSGEVYERMPNDTDFTIFMQSGIQGLNFAFIGSDEHYHQSTDDIAHLDLRSLRHHGRQALALARRFASLDAFASPHGPGESIYFDVLGLFVVRYPRMTAIPAAGVICIFLPVLFFLAWKNRQLRMRGMMHGVAGCTVGAVMAFAACWLIAGMFPGARREGSGPFVMYAMLTASMLLPVILFCMARRFADTSALASGGLLIWAAFAMLSAIYTPGGSYLTLIPSVLYFIGCIGLLQRRPTPRGTAVTWWISGVVAILLIVPTTVLASQALSLDLTPVVMMLPALAAWMLGPIFARLDFTAFTTDAFVKRLSSEDHTDR